LIQAAASKGNWSARAEDRSPCTLEQFIHHRIFGAGAKASVAETERQVPGVCGEINWIPVETVMCRRFRGPVRLALL
jgi:hypothetical protein